MKSCVEDRHIRKGWTFDHYVQDFKLFPVEDILRGKYENLSNRSYVFVGRHELLEDLYHTCEHEDIHAVLDHIITEDNLFIDVDMEHWAILQMAWAEELLV